MNVGKILQIKFLLTVSTMCGEFKRFRAIFGHLAYVDCRQYKEFFFYIWNFDIVFLNS